MTPTVIHRHTFALNDAVEALLGEAVGDCQGWSLRVDGDQVVIDVVNPAQGVRFENAKNAPPADENPKDANEVDPDSEPEPLKGGPLAKKAAMLCDKKAFQTFMDAQGAGEAADAIRVACGVKSRAELDHVEAAATKFHDIDRRFSLWQDGYDVDSGD